MYVEYSDRFQLLLDVPGVEPKDVEITLDSGVLTVSGNRPEERAVGTNGTEEPQQQRLERRPGTVSSTLHTPGHGRCRERQCVRPQRSAGDRNSQAAEIAASPYYGEVTLDRFAALSALASPGLPGRVYGK